MRIGYIHIDAQYAALPETAEGYDATVTAHWHRQGEAICQPRNYEIKIPANAVSFIFTDHETADHSIICKVDEKVVREIIEKLDLRMGDIEPEYDVFVPLKGTIVGERTMWKRE